MSKLWGLPPAVPVIIILLLLQCPQSSFADLIQVKGKTFINGKIISESEKEIVFEKALGGERETYALSDVRIIGRDKEANLASQVDADPLPEETSDPPETTEDNEKKMEDLQRQIDEAGEKMPSMAGGVTATKVQEAYSQAIKLQKMRTDYTKRAIVAMENGEPSSYGDAQGEERYPDSEN